MHPLICLLLALAGVFFFGLGLRLLWGDRQFRTNARPVKVTVTELRTEKDSEGDDVHRAQFKVVDGEFAGSTHYSEFVSYPAIHKPGYVGNGLYQPASGRIESLRTAGLTRFFGLLLTLIGGALIATAVFQYFGGNL